MGLHFDGFIVWRGVLVAREPASRSVNKTSLSASETLIGYATVSSDRSGLAVCALPALAL